MMSVEERIKQVFEKERKSRNLLSNPTVESAVSLMYSRIEKEVLQILKEQKMKWCELLKLHKELRRNFELLVRYSSKRNVILSSVRIHNLGGSIEKIEEKLEEIQPI